MEIISTTDGDVTIEEMKKEVDKALKAYVENKERIKDLNTSNSELVKYLDKKYKREKGTMKAYFNKIIKQAEGKDLSEDVFEIYEKLHGGV